MVRGILAARVPPRGRLADGWFPMVGPGPQLDKALGCCVRPPSRRAGTRWPSRWKAESPGGAAPKN
ncbi:hypothetical protein I552_6450 [Mycobacterium xenopi 3993]|nr:hypothetical protein I552_6450 [Mycobacterium xenopi 3993]